MGFDWQRPTNQGIMALPDRYSVESEGATNVWQVVVCLLVRVFRVRSVYKSIW